MDLALCYNPRFVGSDDLMFYFHGAKGLTLPSCQTTTFTSMLTSSDPDHREGHGTSHGFKHSPSCLTHALVLSARRVSHWDDNVDTLIVRWDGEEGNIPTDGETEWRVSTRERLVVERTEDVNRVRVKATGLVQMDVKVSQIGEEDNRVHIYQLPADDAFAHLETQFRFFELSKLVNGVLGKTYRSGYVTPVKRGVPMPMMDGEDKHQTPSLYSTVRKACRFQRLSGSGSI